MDISDDDDSSSHQSSRDRAFFEEAQKRSTLAERNLARDRNAGEGRAPRRDFFDSPTPPPLEKRPVREDSEGDYVNGIPVEGASRARALAKEALEQGPHDGDESRGEGGIPIDGGGAPENTQDGEEVAEEESRPRNKRGQFQRKT